MKQNPVMKESLLVLLGETVGVGAMFGVFALLGKMDNTVLLGGIIGGLLTFLNFFFMAVCVSVAVDRAKSGNTKSGQNLLAWSRILRLLALFGLMFLAAKSDRCNVIALVVPLLFQQPTLLLCEFFRKSGESET